MTAVYALLGTGIGLGTWLVWWSLRSAPPSGSQALTARLPAITNARLRLALAGGAALIALAATRWPVAVLAAGAAGWFAPDLVGGGARRSVTVDRAVAVASWAEMLRDTLAASSGLEEAIAVTAPLTDPSIRLPVERLVADLDRVRLADGLAALADELGDPTADLVVSALVLAARGEAQNLIDLLGSLAHAAREDAEMRLRVDAARARIRTSVRVIAGITIAMVIGLVVLNRSYLAPFGTVGGQLVLAAIFAGFGAGLAWLQRLSRYEAPDRFLTRRDEVPAA